MSGAWVNLDDNTIKNIFWVIGGFASSFIALTLGFWIGIAASMIVALVITSLLKVTFHDYSITAKDILLYITSIIAWSSIGSAISPLLAIGPLGWITIIMLLSSALLLDFVIIHSRILNRRSKVIYV